MSYFGMFSEKPWPSDPTLEQSYWFKAQETLEILYLFGLKLAFPMKIKLNSFFM